jgi:hypothetical protein
MEITACLELQEPKNLICLYDLFVCRPVKYQIRVSLSSIFSAIREKKPEVFFQLMVWPEIRLFIAVFDRSG